MRYKAKQNKARRRAIMNQPIFEKITKLLRLAERATGPEAELALMRATQFATEHQIDLATIDTSEGEAEQKESFGEEAVTDGGKKPLRRFILWLLQNHFRVKGVIWTYSGTIKLIGRKSDVVFAQYLFSWLMEHFQNEWRAELNKPGSTGGTRRSSNAFFYGMYQGLDQKLKDAKRETEEVKIRSVACEKSVEGEDVFVAERQVSQKYQLALVSEKDALEEEYYRLHPDLRKRRGTFMRINHNAAGMAAGRAAGARTRLPGIPLGNSTRSALS